MERRHKAKITSKGQVTMPVEVRKALGINNGDVLVIRESTAGYVNLALNRQEAAD